MKTIGNYTFFWGASDVLSNWHLSEFVVGSIKFNRNEQHMMYRKSLLFGDTVTAAKILREPDAKRQKDLGQQVTPWVESVWVANRMRIMVEGLYAKFSQNPKMALVLLGTGTTTLVEASPYDDIWGVKLGVDHPDILDPAKWRGLNLLGQALESVRTMLRKKLGISLDTLEPGLPAGDEEARAAFEAWANEKGYKVRDQWMFNTFLDPRTREAWEGFSALWSMRGPVLGVHAVYRCRDCYGPLGEEHSDTCGLASGPVTPEHVGDSPIPVRYPELEKA